MKIISEKEKFSERLRYALNIAYPKGIKTSQIATKFNLQYTNTPVTQQAVHKWLNGLAMPADDKIETLANWLKVKPEWLKYGIVEDNAFSISDDILLELIKSLSPQQKKLLTDLIISFK